MTKPRLQERYENTVRAELKEKLGLANPMDIPRIEKIVLNVGVKDAVSDSKSLQRVEDVLSRIAGQKTVRTKAKKSIAGFKLREGMSIGVMVTLRKKNMYEFLDRLINLALPKVRDFQGVPTSLDRRGNYNLGVKDWTIFPELDADVIGKTLGMNITIQTSSNIDDHARELLRAFGMPFRK